MSDTLINLYVQPGETISGKYDIIDLLGAGRFGQVFYVFNRLLGIHSALKIVRVEDPALHRASVEALAQSICGHDHVVKIITADVYGDEFVLIEMEFIEGGSLEGLLKDSFITVDKSVEYIKNILFALEHAHSRGIVHRDVKPANIMISSNGAKLSDFGTAIHPHSGVSVTDMFYQLHAAPEAVNFGDFSARTDVYAAGLTLMRAVNNMPSIRHYFPEDSWVGHVQNGTVLSKVGVADYVPRSLKAIINRACSNDIERRYQSASAFRQALEGLRFQRSWEKLSDSHWSCIFNGKEEEIILEKGRKFSVEYLIAKRRKISLCEEFSDERTARKYMAKKISESMVRGI